uniref:Uncharacterized protein n=1 Tax=Romanomermis culicivorax TaxID=13658 RepID=A0A915J484_ROMCU
MHFVCAKCEKPFLGTRHYEKKGLAYCELHFYQLFGNVCFKCGQVITGDVFQALQKAWCIKCFACTLCDKKMDQKSKFYELDMKPVCKRCYDKMPNELRKRLSNYYKNSLKQPLQQTPTNESTMKNGSGENTVIGILPVSGYTVNYIDEFRTISLRLISGDEFLVLNSATKQLILIQALDRETKGSKIEAVVECSSILADDDFQVNITVYINIKDVNDNPPKFPSDVLRIQVNEELPISSVIYSSLKAFDADSSGPNSEISYYTVMNSSNHEDNGQPRLNSTILFIVDVVDIDDQNPKFEYDQYSVTMNFSQTNNTLTVLPKPIKASDQDTLNSSIFYTLSGVHSDKFRINRDDGKLSSDHVFKRTDFFLLTIHAAQTDKPERQATAVLVVKSNLSTNLLFSDSKYSVNVKETARIGQEIFKIEVIEENSNGKLRFLLDDASGKFIVEEKTGVVRLKQNLDYEHRKNYNLSCRVSNGLDVAVVSLEIHVQDVNESPPKFELDEYIFKPWSTEDGSFVGHVRATDLDTDDKITYQLIDSTKIFRLNETGAIFIGNGSSIRNTSYLIVIYAADNGRPSKSSRCKIFVGVQFLWLCS